MNVRWAATASFILGIITLFLMGIYLLSIIDYRILTLLPKFIKWFFLLLTIYFFQYGLFFLTTAWRNYIWNFWIKVSEKNTRALG